MNRLALSSLVFLFVFTFFLPILNLKAVTFVPASGTYAPSTQFNINVTASPTGAGSNAVAIRLTFVNATVINFVPVTGGSWVGATQDCAGPAYFTSSTVCASLAKSIPIVAGETLGTLTIRLANTAGTATVTKASGNIYSDGVTSFPDLGIVANFTISASATSLPNTSFFDFNEGVIVVSSLLLIGVGALLLKLKPFNNLNI